MAEPVQISDTLTLSVTYTDGAWRAHVRVLPDGETLTATLSVSDPDAVLAAFDEAMEFAGAGLPRVVDDAHTARTCAPFPALYRLGGAWRLVAWCDECGSFELEMPREIADPWAARRLADRYRVAAEQTGRCPGCLSEALRDGTVSPTHGFVWLDLPTQEWHVWLDAGDGLTAAIPLGVRLLFCHPDDVTAARDRLLVDAS